MKIAFFVWNPFQIYQFESVVRRLPGSATYLLEKRKSLEFDRLFTPEFMATLEAPVRIVSRAEMAELDGEYDAIVCQTAFGHMERFEKTKLVGLQYSMSKERHQYGPWRSMCDLNLVYGQYSLDRISPLSPCTMVGNPRFDRWFEGGLEPAKLEAVRARLDPSKKTVLYLPTWGELSSMTDYGAAVAALGEDCNVIAKVHHKTDTHEAGRKIALTNSGVSEIFGASDDLLHLLHESDVVLSDFSGAIFDAINVRKPVILLQRDPEQLASMGAEKFGLESIEYALRDSIGPVASEPEQLADVVRRVLDGSIDFSDRNDALKRACFSQEQDCGGTAARAIEDLIENGRSRPYHQIYVRDALREFRIESESNKRPLLKVAKAIAAKRPAGAPATEAPRRSLPRRLLRAAVVPARKLIERYVGRVANGAGNAGAPFEPSPIVNRLARLLRPQRLIALSQRYDARPTCEASIWLARVASQKNSKIGLTAYIKVLAKYNRRDELIRLFDSLAALPLKDKATYLQRASRIQDFIGTRDEQLRAIRKEVFDHVVERLSTSRSRVRNAAAMRVLVTNRWLDEAAQYESTAALTAAARRRTRQAVDRSKGLLREFWPLVGAANRNHAPALAAGDHLCLWNGEIQPVSATAASKVVEYFLPPYFFSESETEAATRERICVALVNMLRALAEQGVAVVPRQQFRLENAHPSGHWPAMLSYHTTGSLPGWWHVKDAPLSGYFSIDPEGYSGWSSVARLTALPDSARRAPAAEVEAVWQRLHERFVANKVSKYHQGEASFTPPSRPYVFIPLQTVGDVVARLARIPTLDLARMVIELAASHDLDIVIKRHPKCSDAGVAEFVDSVRDQPGVHVTTASIHDVIAGAAVVATVNSGVGLEALLHGKAVIVSGEAEYNLAARRVGSKPELLAALQDAARNGPDLDLIKRFVYFYMSEVLVAGDDPEAIARRLRTLLQPVFAHEIERAAAA